MGLESRSGKKLYWRGNAIINVEPILSSWGGNIIIKWGPSFGIGENLMGLVLCTLSAFQTHITAHIRYMCENGRLQCQGAK